MAPNVRCNAEGAKPVRQGAATLKVVFWLMGKLHVMRQNIAGAAQSHYHTGEAKGARTLLNTVLRTAPSSGTPACMVAILCLTRT